MPPLLCDELAFKGAECINSTETVEDIYIPLRSCHCHHFSTVTVLIWISHFYLYLQKKSSCTCSHGKA